MGADSEISSLRKRALAALDEGFSEQVKAHFGRFFGDIVGDSSDAEARFRKGLAALKTAYPAFRGLIEEEFPDNSEV